jgi:hypothetical protein
VKTLRHQPDVDLALREALEQWSRADEVWDAITWTIARDNSVGKPLSEAGNVRTYTIQGAISVGWPTLTIIYRVESERIVIEAAKFERPRHVQAGNS